MILVKYSVSLINSHICHRASSSTSQQFEPWLNCVLVSLSPRQAFGGKTPPHNGKNQTTAWGQLHDYSPRLINSKTFIGLVDKIQCAS